jgi:hypothetical protein
MTLGRAVAGASGLALMLVMFMPWFGGDQLVELPGVGEVSAEGENSSAWESFALIDLVLFAAAAVAVAYALTELPPPVVVTAMGTLAVALVLFRMISPPSLGEGLVGAVETSVGRRIGVFFGLLASAGMALGGYLTGELESAPKQRQPNRGA